MVRMRHHVWKSESNFHENGTEIIEFKVIFRSYVQLFGKQGRN